MIEVEKLKGSVGRWHELTNAGPLKGRAWLHIKIAEFFNEAELKALSFEIGEDYGGLAGAGVNEKALELVSAANRHGKILELLAALNEYRPHVDWKFLK